MKNLVIILVIAVLGSVVFSAVGDGNFDDGEKKSKKSPDKELPDDEERVL